MILSSAGGEESVFTFEHCKAEFMRLRNNLWLAGFFLLAIQDNVHAEVTIDDLVAGVAATRSSLRNVQMEIASTFGTPATQQKVDKIRVSWLGEDGKQEILEREVIRDNTPHAVSENRVTAITSKFAYIIERETAADEWRVSNTKTASQEPLAVSSRFDLIDKWRLLTTTLEGIEIEDLFRRSKDVHIEESPELSSMIVYLQPPADLGGFPLTAMELQFATGHILLTGFRYVYAATAPDGTQSHYRVEFAGEGIKEWQAGLYYPEFVRTSSVRVAGPSLDAEVVSDAVVSTSKILSIESGVVTPETFLPSAHGLPNHIVGLDSPTSTWNPWIVVFVGFNVIAFAGWVMARRRKFSGSTL